MNGVGARTSAAFYNRETGFIDLHEHLNGIGASPLIAFHNAGTLRGLSAAARLSYVAFTNNGTVESLVGTLGFVVVCPYTQLSGVTRLAGGNLRFDDPLQLRGGVLTGAGTITGNVTNNGGVVSPGGPLGRLYLNGHYGQGPAGTLHVEVAGPAPGSQFDQLSLAPTRTATLGGTLRVAVTGGFVPSRADIFPVLTCDWLQGTFASFVASDLEDNNYLSPIYAATGVELAVAGPIPVLLRPQAVRAQSELRFQISGVAGQPYVIEASSNLTHWLPIRTNVIPQSTLLPVTLTNFIEFRERFFRARFGPE
jgi:hypothetical protein